jgi:ribosomal protein S18 acetylase RimI-like enzyme
VRATYRWQVTQESVYVLVADDGGKIIGLIAVSAEPFTLPMFKACLGEFIGSLARHPSLLAKPQVWKRLFRRSSGENAQADAMAHTPGMAQMIIGAVDAESRGRRIFPALIDATTVESRKRGSRAIRAGVYKRNIPVQKAFIKAGWEEAPVFESQDTKYYIQFLDPTFRDGLAYLG